MGRRNDLDICADILAVAREGVRTTRIVYQANLNFKIVKKYLQRLKENGLLKKEDGFFVTTPKGAQFIEQYKGLVSL